MSLCYESSRRLTVKFFKESDSNVTKITFISATGEKTDIEAEDGFTVMEVAVRNNIPGIEADCGGACACATCHVYIQDEWSGTLPPKQEAEEDMLDFAFDVRPNSRLACQIKISSLTEGMIVTAPAKQY